MIIFNNNNNSNIISEVDDIKIITTYSNSYTKKGLEDNKYKAEDTLANIHKHT